MILYGRKEVLPNAKTVFLIENRRIDLETSGYHFWIQHEKLVQKGLHFQKKQRAQKVVALCIIN